MRQVHEVNSVAVDDLEGLVPSWLRHLRASNKAPRTIQSYGEAAEMFMRFLSERGMPTAAGSIAREHVEMWIEDLLSRFKPATALNRYRGLVSLFAFLADEGEITRSPMERMKPPA